MPLRVPGASTSVARWRASRSCRRGGVPEVAWRVELDLERPATRTSRYRDLCDAPRLQGAWLVDDIDTRCGDLVAAPMSSLVPGTFMTSVPRRRRPSGIRAQGRDVLLPGRGV